MHVFPRSLFHYLRRRIRRRNYGFIGAGVSNSIVASRLYAVICGGKYNEVKTSGNYGFIGGGASNDVTRGYAVVCGGQTNTASAYHSFVGGGLSNSAGGDRAAVVGGQNNICSAAFSFIGGGGHTSGASGNHCYSSYSFIGGGRNNDILASRNFSVLCGGENNEIKTGGTHSVIGGGRDNDVTATYGSIAGGRSNAVNISDGAICGGQGNLVSSPGNFGFVGAGAFNSVSGRFAGIVTGYRGVASLYGQIAHASGRFAASGDAQNSVVQVRRSTTDATQTELTLDGAAPGSANRITLSDQDLKGFVAHVVGRRTDADNEGCFFTIKGAIDRNGATTALVDATPAIEEIANDNSGTWSVTADADDTNDSLRILVTGEAAKTIRWSAKVQLQEVNG